VIATLILPLLLQSAEPAGDVMREALDATIAQGEPNWNCDDPIAQQEMNYCAGQDFKAADAALNAQWAITSAKMKASDADFTADGSARYDRRAGYFETLLEAQRAWLRYRDAHCLAVGYSARGGRMEPMLESMCKTQLTEERTQQLKDLAQTN